MHMIPVTEGSMVSVTSVCNLAGDVVKAWALIRDFNAMPAWNDSVRQSYIENGPADRVGCLRVLLFDDGGVWTHRLTGLSDVDMKLQYCIVGTPLPMRIPVWNYRAEINVVRIGSDTVCAANSDCRIEWSATFETARADEMRARAKQVFDAGFSGLRKRLEVLVA